MSIQFLLALQLISDIVLFVAVIFLLAIVGRNSWKKNSSPPNSVDKQAIADLERLISESQAATANLIKAMDESRRALKEAVCEVEEKEFRIIQRESRVSKREAPALIQAVSHRDQKMQDARIEDSGRDMKVIRLAGSEIESPEKSRGNDHGRPGQAEDYQAVIEMARKGLSEKEIMDQSELTEAEISLVLELGRKRKDFD